MKTLATTPVLIVQQVPTQQQGTPYPDVFVATVGTMDADGTPRNGMTDQNPVTPGMGFRFAIYRGSDRLCAEYSVPNPPRAGYRAFNAIAKTLKKLEDGNFCYTNEFALALVKFCDILKIKHVVNHDGDTPPYNYTQWKVVKTPVTEFALKLATTLK